MLSPAEKRSPIAVPGKKGSAAIHTREMSRRPDSKEQRKKGRNSCFRVFFQTKMRLFVQTVVGGGRGGAAARWRKRRTDTACLILKKDGVSVLFRKGILGKFFADTRREKHHILRGLGEGVRLQGEGENPSALFPRQKAH